MEPAATVPDAAPNQPSASPFAKSQRIAGAAKAAASRLLPLASFDQRLPLVFDLVEDAARSRGMTLALFGLLICFLFRSGLYVLFLTNPTQNSQSQQLVYLNFLPSGAEIGKVPGPAITVRITDTAGRPVHSVTAKISLTLQQTEPDASWIRHFGYTDTMYAESGIPIDGRYALPGFPPRALAVPTLRGDTAVSDVDGYARFRSFRMLTGLAESYQVTVSAAGTTLSLGNVRFSSRVTQVVILGMELDGTFVESFRRPVRVRLGEPIPPIRIRVLGEQGAPLSDKSAVLICAPPDPDEFASVGQTNDIFHPRSALIANSQSALTGINGTTVLRNVTLLSSSIRRLRFWVVVDGIVATTVAGQRTLRFTLGPRKHIPRRKSVFERLPSAALRSTDVLMDEYHVEVLSQPAASVIEGEVLAQQPTIAIHRFVRGPEGTLRLVPAVGARVFAFPYAQRGIKSDTIMSPEASAELGIVKGDKWAILGNLGRMKLLFNATSLPSDAQGIARFQGMGFIRHGPAGNYTLSFAYAGVHLYAESQPIAVLSSVAQVLHLSQSVEERRNDDAFWKVEGASGAGLAAGELNLTFTLGGASIGTFARQQPSTTSIICGFPTCQATFGNTAGAMLYAGLGAFKLNARGFNGPWRIEDLDDMPLPAGVSGQLSLPPQVVVRDRHGRPLAGKVPVPVVVQSVNAQDQAPCGVRIEEFPHRGATVSKLGMPGEALALVQSTVSVVGWEGIAAYSSRNLDSGFSLEAQYASTVAPWSFFRVVSSSALHCVASWTFEVEGVGDGDVPATLDVFNWDARVPYAWRQPHQPPPSDVCTYMNIKQAPAMVLQDGAQQASRGFELSQVPGPFLGDDGKTPRPFILETFNSLGQPVVTPDIWMFITDSLGYIMYSELAGQHLAVDGQYVDFLRQQGGAGVFGVGSILTGTSGTWLHPHAARTQSNTDGIAYISNMTIIRAQNTWFTVTFAARYPGLTRLDLLQKNFTLSTDSLAQQEAAASTIFPASHTCVSQYSSPIAVRSTIDSIEWEIDDNGRFNESIEAPGTTLHQQLNKSASETFTLPFPLRVHPSTTDPTEVESLQPSDLPPARLMGAVDEELLLYPAHAGVRVYEFMAVATPDEESLLQTQNIPVLATEFYRLPSDQQEGLQVSSVSGLESVLGTTPSFFAPVREEVGETAHVELQRRCNNRTCRISGEVPELSISMGEVGVFELTVFAGGHVVEPALEVAITNEVNTVIIHDFDVATYGNTTSCFGGHSLLSSTEVLQVLDQPNPCPAGIAGLQCSGHGICMCGFCLCTDGWDGAFDCSRQYAGDGFAPAFAQLRDPAFGLEDYPGLPVYDVRRAMQLINSGNARYFGDLFPRFILGRQVSVGKADLESVQIVLQVLGDLAAETASTLPARTVAGDSLNAAFQNKTAGTNLQFLCSLFDNLCSVPAQPAGGLYSVFPVLFTCSGEEVADWSFVEGETGCAWDTVPVVSVPIGPGNSSFAAYKADFYYDNELDTISTEPRLDWRIHLYGVPSGCYRFKYVYAPMGPGSRAERRIQDPWRTATARSVGSSRPFRVFSPVAAIRQAYDARTTDFVVVHDAPIDGVLSFDIRPAAIVADDADLAGVPNGNTLVDTCSDADKGLIDGSRRTGIPRRRGKARCPPTPEGGLDFTMTAVSIVTGEEYSLYTTSDFNDCRRVSCPPYGFCSLDLGSDVMEKLTFPSSPAPIPYGAGRLTAKAVKTAAGAYKLRISAYGTSVLSTSEFHVLDGPTHVLVDDDLRIYFPTDVAMPPVNATRLLLQQAAFHAYLGLGEHQALQSRRVFAAASRDLAWREQAALPMVYECFDWGDETLCETCDEAICYALPLVFPNRTVLPVLMTKSWRLLNLLCGYETGNVDFWLGKCAAEKAMNWLSVPGVSFTVQLRYGPAYANAVLSPSRTLLSMPQQGQFVAAVLPLVSGASGWYVFTVAAQNSNAEEAVMAFNVTNPVSSVRAVWRGKPLTPPRSPPPCTLASGGNTPYAQSPWSPTFTAVETEGVSGSLSVCAMGLPLQMAERESGGTPASGGDPRLVRPPQRLQIRFIVPLADSVYSDNCTLRWPSSCQSTLGTAEPIWLQAMRGAIEHDLVDMSCPEQVDPRRDLDLGARVKITRVVNGQKEERSGLLGDIPQLYTDEEGCVEISGLTFSRVTASVPVRMLVSVRGVEAPPLDFKLVTLAEARPVSTNELQQKIAIPVAAAMPAFGANIVSLPVRFRALCLIVGSLAMAIMAGTEGQSFFQDYARLTSIFAEKDTAFILALNAMWLCSMLAVAYYCLVEFLELRHHMKRWIVQAYKRWMGKLPKKDYEVYAHKEDEQRRRISGSFYNRRYEAAWVYVSLRLPRLGPWRDLGEKHDRDIPIPAKTHKEGYIKGWLHWLHAHIPMESAELAFFFPQRLLVALVVSLLFSALVIMLLLYIAGHLADYADAAVAFIVGAQQRAAMAVAEASKRQSDVVSGSVAMAVDWASEQGTPLPSTGIPTGSDAGSAGIEKALLENAITAALEVSFTGDSESTSGGLPPSLAASLSRVQQLGFLPADSLLSGGASLTSAKLLSMLQQLQSAQTDLLRPYLDAAILQLRLSILHGVVAAVFLVVWTWADLLVTYRRAVLAKRLGKRNEFPYAYGWENRACSPGKAVTFVGIQAAGVSFTMLLSAVVFCLVSLAFSVPQSLQIIKQYVLSVVSALVGITFLMTLLRHILLSFVVVRNRQILLRKLFAIFDLWFTFFNIVTGIAVAAIRLAVGLVSFLAVLMRPDFPVATLLASADPASGSFLALFHLDQMYHNPTFLLAGSLFTAMHAEVVQGREKQGVTRTRSSGCLSRRGSAAVPSSTTAETQSAQGSTSVVVNPLAKGGATSAQSAASARGIKSIRARTRWWLFGMLAAHPGLRAHRKHTLTLAHSSSAVDSEEMGELELS